MKNKNKEEERQLVHVHRVIMDHTHNKPDKAKHQSRKHKQRHDTEKGATFVDRQHDAPQETTTESDTHPKGTVTLDDIPSELIAMMLEMVDDVDVVVCEFVNKQWHHLLAPLKRNVPEKAKFCSRLASLGYLELLKWARTNGCPWDKRTCFEAAKGGHLELLKWAHANGCPWDKDTCFEAAKGGHLEVLQWARENGCPWNEYTCTYAAQGGHLEVLQWARTNGCPWECEHLYICSTGRTLGSPSMGPHQRLSLA